MLERAPLVSGTVYFGEAIARPEIVFGSCAADGWKLAVAIDVELDFAFPKPAVGQLRPGQERPHVTAFALDAIQERVARRRPVRNRPPPLGVEGAGIWLRGLDLNQRSRNAGLRA